MDGDREDRAGTGTGVEASKRTQDGNGDGSGDGAGTGMGVETRRQTQGGNGDGSGDGNKSSSGKGNGNENGDGDGIGDGIGDGNGNENREGNGGGGEIWYSPHRERSRGEDQALPFRTRHHLCRQEVASAGSQQLLAQDPAPARRCGIEGRTGHHIREGGNGDRGRDGGVDRREDEYGDEHEGRYGGKNGSGSGIRNGDENRDEGGGERKPGNLRSDNRGGSEDATRRATPTSNQQPQLQDPMPQRDSRIVLRTRAQGREARGRVGESVRETKKLKKPHKNCRCDVGNGGGLRGDRKKRRQESVGVIAPESDNLENSKGAGREAQDTQSSRKNCTSRESVSSLSGLYVVMCWDGIHIEMGWEWDGMGWKPLFLSYHQLPSQHHHPTF